MKNWNLQHRVLFLGILPGLLISLVLGTYFTVCRFQDLDNLLEERTVALAKQMARALEYNNAIFDSENLRQLARNTLESNDVRSVRIYDSDMQLMEQAGPVMSKRVLSSQSGNFSNLIRTKDSIRVRAPVFSSGGQEALYNLADSTNNPAAQLNGWIELELSNSNTRVAQYQHLVTAILIIGGGLVLCLILALRISARVSHPILEILRCIHDLKDGRYDSRARVDGKGDIYAMASGLNSLASNLQRIKKEHQLTIEQATRDLQETMDDLEIRNRELVIEQKEAQLASKTQSEFLANVSHEIRTPLNSILGYIGLLERTELHESQRDNLKIVKQSSDHLLNMINDLLDIHRLDAGRLILAHDPLNLRDVLEEVMVSLAPSAFQKGLEVCYHIAPEVPLNLKGDQQRLRQIFTNLIGNAVKFTEQGQVNVEVTLIRTQQGRVSINFEIQDTGIGMTEEAQGRLFQAFSQADASTARRFGGTGLGLRISRSLIQAMNGDIKVRSELGKGSTFSFYVTSDLDKTPGAGLPAFDGLTLALLDYKVSVSRDLCQLLDQWKVRLIPCDDIDSLVDLVESEHEPEPDGILLGINQKCIGSDICKQISSRIPGYRIPIITLVNSVDDELFSRLTELGSRAILARPFTQYRIHSVLTKIFRDSPEEITAEAPAQPSLIRPPLIMAVDDNEANLKLVVTLLSDLGVRVLGASSGAEAIDIARLHKPDLIFMDIQMPEMNGLECMLAIRELPGKSHIPVVALTAHAMADEKKMLLGAGMNDYQTKPIIIERLIECVHHWTGFIPAASAMGQRLNIYPENSSYSPESARETHDQPRLVISEQSEMTLPVFSPADALKHSNYKTDLAIEMMEILLRSLPADLNLMKELWEEEQLESLFERVHKVHGASRYCGVPAFQQALADAETALKKKDHNKLPDTIKKLIATGKDLHEWSISENWKSELKDRPARLAAVRVLNGGVRS